MAKFVGQVSEMIKAQLSINGVPLSQPQLSALTTLGEMAGFCKKAGKKGIATIWELDLNPSFFLEVKSRNEDKA
jgi:hypothetical protein